MPQEQGDDIIEVVTNDLAGPLKYLTIITEGVKRIKKFNIDGKTLVFKLNDVGESANPILWLQVNLPSDFIQVQNLLIDY